MPTCRHEPSCVETERETCGDTNDIPAAKPIRVFQFILVSIIVALTAFTIFQDSPYELSEAIPLMVIYGSFLFVTLIDIVSQYSGDPIPDTPMFLFGIAGTVLFFMAAFGIYFVTRRNNVVEIWRIIAVLVLSVVIGFIYLVDVIFIYLYGY